MIQTKLEKAVVHPVWFLATIIFAAGTMQCRAATVTWANTNGGDWNIATNWSPAQVPVSGDDVIITNSGTYTITNASNVTLDNLILGGTNGMQALNISSLTLTNVAMVNSNGVLIWSGGDLEGALAVAQGGTLVQSNTLHFVYNNYALGYTNTAYLTNYGTVVWAGTIDAAANSSTHGGGGVIYNAGLWDAVADMTMGVYSGTGTNYFINAGTLEKTGGTGTSVINWMFSNNGGTINTSGGAFSMGNWIGNGVVHGSAAFLGGTITGTLASDCVVNASATITGSMFISSNAVANWNGGDVEGSLTVDQGGTLTQSNTLHFVYNNYAMGYTNTGCLTNYGTVIWGGTIDAAANGTTHGGGGIIYNAGVWDAVADMTMGVYSGSGTNYFINAGTLEKTGGTGTSTLNWSFSNNGATINTLSGAFSMGNWIGNGVVHGTATFSGGTMTGTLASDCVVNASATITGSMFISSNAVANWNGGDVEGSLTVDQGGTLTQSNTLHFVYNNYAMGYTNTGCLTNYGTVIWGGTIDAAANGTTHGGGGIIYNAGVWDAVADMTMGVYSGSGTNYFINAGTLEKTTATGTSTIGWNFSSSGVIETYSGTFNLNWGGPSVLNGNLTLNGTIAVPLTVASNAVLNLAGGDLESFLTVLPGGTLTISNTVIFAQNNHNYGYTNTAALTNYGTVVWAGTIEGAGSSYGGGGLIYNAGLWQAVADNTMSLYSGNATNLFINVGTLEKIGGTGTSTIGWNFDNEGGTINTPSGSFSMGNWIGSGLVHGNATLSSGSTIGGIIASNALVTWLGGDLEGSLTVAQGGTLTISNTVILAQNNHNYGYTNTATLTNYGTVVWAGTIEGAGSSYGGGGLIYNAGLWQAVADNTMSLYSGNATNLFINVGTLEKIGGTGTTTISWNYLNDGGILGSQTHTLSLTGNYDLTGGTLNFGINSLGNYGIIHLSGSPAVLAGSASANFNNGYVAATGNSFPVLTYSSKSGAFSNFIPPFAVAMQTNYGSTTFTLTVLNVRPTLAAIANQNIAEVTPLNATASATDPDSGQTLTFALVSAPESMTINPTTGAISWTPAQTQSPSTNTVSVSVRDNGTPPLSATNSFVVTVYEVNDPPIPPLIPTQTVNAQALLTVNDTATETNIHATVGYFLLSAPAGAEINSSGIITWTPLRSQGPNTITITAVATNADIYDLTNTYLSATNSFTVIVYAPTLAPIGNYTVNAGQTVSFTASATDNDSTRTLTFSLVSPPSGASINGGSGLFNWRPTVSQADTTNTVQVSVADNSTPSLSDSKSFLVVVNPLAPVILTPISYTNSQFKFRVSGTTGPDYIITASTNLSAWNDIFTNLSPATPFQFTNSITLTNRFYRVRLSP